MKLQLYFGHNVLAKSLHPKCYQHNPTFLRLRDERQLPFVADPRRVHRRIVLVPATAVPAHLRTVVEPAPTLGINVPAVSSAAVREQEKQQRYYGVSLNDLLEAGIARPGQAIVGTQKD